MLVGLDFLFEHLHAVERCCKLRADGGMSSHLLFADYLGRTCCVVSLYHLKLRVTFEKIAALHQSHRMRVDFCDVCPVLIRKAHDGVRDAQLVFAYDLHSAFAKELVVVEQRTGNGVLYGNKSNDIAVLLHLFKHLFEGVAADEFYLCALEISVACHIVETSHFSLYCYFNHTAKKIPLCNERDNLICLSFYFLCLYGV